MDADENKILIKAHAYQNSKECADYYLHFKGPISATWEGKNWNWVTWTLYCETNLCYGTAILIIVCFYY